MESTAHKIEAKERTSDVKLSDKIPFNKMMLSSGVRNGLHRAGYVYPTVLQANAIPIGKAGIDLIVQSKSGTGKTLIFTVVLLETIYDTAGQHPQALILVPTREIAIQIENTLNVLGSCCPGFKAVSVIGGLDVTADRKKIQNARAVVGTPGRVLHLIHNEIFNTSDIKLLVIDEADKMMTSTFRGDFENIYNSLPAKKQIIACSATFCNQLDTVLAKFMRYPFLISTEKRTTSLLGIKQLIYELPEEKTNILEMQAKVTALCQIFSHVAFQQCMIFSNSQSRAESYRSFLDKEGWPCEVITGGQDQKTRIDIFNKFREFKTRILVSTDLMARGIDSENVNLVINLELPDDGSTYLHRVGRAGRFGSHGIAISFIASRKDREKFKKLLDKIGFDMEILKFPKNHIVDLWNFNDPDGEKLQLGVFDVNDNTECEKENINNNCMIEAEALNSTELNTKKHSLQNELKRDVLKHLIDLKTSNLIAHRNGNLFSDFIEETTVDKVKVIKSEIDSEEEPIVHQTSSHIADDKEEIVKFINTSTQYSDRDSIHSEKSRKSLVDLVCDTQDKKIIKPESDIFDDFNTNEKEDTENEKNTIEEPQLESIPQESLKTECVDRVVSNEVTNSPKDTTCSNPESVKSVVPDSVEKNIPENRKKALHSLLLEKQTKQKNEDIFCDFQNLEADTSANPIPCTSVEQEAKSKEIKSENIAIKSKTKSPKSLKAKSNKPSKEAIKDAIREVHDHIVSSSDSVTKLATLKSFSELQPSISMQPYGPSTDNSDMSNYPNTSCPTSVTQTNQDMINISSLTEDGHISLNTSDLNNSAKQEPGSTTASFNEGKTKSSSSSSSIVEKSSTDLDSNTETATEQNETSGFNEEDSVASSGVITTSSSYSPSSEYTTTMSGSDSSSLLTTEISESSSDSDSESTVESKKEKTLEKRRTKRRNIKKLNDFEAYQKAFTGWTELYWNQVSHIQDYVNFYKYAKAHASEYS